MKQHGLIWIAGKFLVLTVVAQACEPCGHSRNCCKASETCELNVNGGTCFKTSSRITCNSFYYCYSPMTCCGSGFATVCCPEASGCCGSSCCSSVRRSKRSNGSSSRRLLSRVAVPLLLCMCKGAEDSSTSSSLFVFYFVFGGFSLAWLCICCCVCVNGWKTAYQQQHMTATTYSSRSRTTAATIYTVNLPFSVLAAQNDGSSNAAPNDCDLHPLEPLSYHDMIGASVLAEQDRDATEISREARSVKSARGLGTPRSTIVTMNPANSSAPAQTSGFSNVMATDCNERQTDPPSYHDAISASGNQPETSKGIRL